MCDVLGLRIWGMMRQGLGVELFSGGIGSIMITVRKDNDCVIEFVSEEETEDATMNKVEIHLKMIQRRKWQ